MTPSANLAELLSNARAWEEGFQFKHLKTQPRRHLTILTCMDSRIFPNELFGLDEGDAHIVRNAGGIYTEDVARSLAISQHMLETREIFVVQHTFCGLLAVTDEQVADRLERETGQTPPWHAHAFTDLDANVADTVAKIKADPFIPHTENVSGFVYDVDSGNLRQVI